jgi:hypothetical protein
MTVILVNRERVVFECLELARLKIGRMLGILHTSVSASCSSGEKGNLQIKFEVVEGAVKDQPPEKIQSVIAGVYAEVRTRMDERFAGLGARRHDEEEEKATPTEG